MLKDNFADTRFDAYYKQFDREYNWQINGGVQRQLVNYYGIDQTLGFDETMLESIDEKQLYTCGMHPEIISDEPGLCPICEMNLTPIKNDEQKGGERKIIYWRAPMDPNEIYDAPGKSKMGMDLVPVYEDEAAGSGIDR